MPILEDGINHIFPEEFLPKYREGSINLIDIREPFELLELPIYNANNIPLNRILVQYEKLLIKDELYYIICHHGQRSYYVTELLTNKGYNVINVAGGIDLVNRFDRAKR